MSFLDKTGLTTLWSKIKDLVYNVTVVSNYNNILFIEESKFNIVGLKTSETPNPVSLCYITKTKTIVAKGNDGNYYRSWSATSSIPDMQEFGTISGSGIIPSTENIYYISGQACMFTNTHEKKRVIIGVDLTAQ